MYNIELQKKVLEIFKEFKKICENNDLKYFAIGGTCLGAIRHKGFIPWDDDLDVAMPIDDYEKFRRIAKKELSDNYGMIDYLDDDYYFLRFLKMHDKTTTFVEKYELDFPYKYKGVYIDIMPIVGISKNIFKAIFFKIRYYIIFKLDKSLKQYYEEKKSLKGKIFWILSRVLFLHKEKNYYAKKYDKLCKKYEINCNNNIFFPWRIPLKKPYSNIFNYKDFCDCYSVEFEDTTICVPIGYDSYLKQDFGCYMKLPDESKRVCHNPSILDLHKSYLYYINKKG